MTKMVKMDLSEDEWYPILTPFVPQEWMTDERLTEVPEELVLAWNEAKDRFFDIEKQLRKYYGER